MIDEIDVAGDLLQGHAPPGLGFADREGAESGGEPTSFHRPVADDARRGHDQIGRLAEPPFLGVAHEGQGLDGLTESHVVGQNASEPVFVEVRQPVEPGQLIGPEGGIEADGHVVFDPRARLGEGAHGGLPFTGLGRHDAEALEVFPQARLEAAEADGVTSVVGERPGFGDELGQLAQFGPVEGEVGAGGKDEMRPFVGQGHEEVGEGHIFALDGDGHRQVEPVPIVRRGTSQADDRRVDDLPVGGDRPDVFDLHSVDLRQGGEKLGDEEHGRHRFENGVRGQARTVGGDLEQSGHRAHRRRHGLEDGVLGLIVGAAHRRIPQPLPFWRSSRPPGPRQQQVVRLCRM